MFAGSLGIASLFMLIFMVGIYIFIFYFIYRVCRFFLAWCNHVETKWKDETKD